MNISAEVLQEQAEIVEVDATKIKEYVMTRSINDPKLFSVYAIDNEGSILYAAAVDVDFETAAQDVEQLNFDLNKE